MAAAKKAIRTSTSRKTLCVSGLVLWFISCACFALENKSLSSLNLYEIDNKTVTLKNDVHPYAIKTRLFTDYAWKWRALRLPKGARITISDDGEVLFPDGSLVVKTFYYPKAEGTDGSIQLKEQPIQWAHSIDKEKSVLVETRILKKSGDTWIPSVYIWNDDATDATLQNEGKSIELSINDSSSSDKTLYYEVPSEPQCSECHSGFSNSLDNELLGPHHNQLNINLPIHHNTEGEHNQLTALIQRGIIKTQKPVLPDADHAIEIEYLHVNCAHCHNPYGTASSSRLYLNREESSLWRRGICKPSIAAGRGTAGLDYDVVPGAPSKSILYQRMKSTVPEIRMPEIGRTLADKNGLEIVENWILQLDHKLRGCETK